MSFLTFYHSWVLLHKVHHLRTSESKHRINMCKIAREGAVCLYPAENGADVRVQKLKTIFRTNAHIIRNSLSKTKISSNTASQSVWEQHRHRHIFVKLIPLFLCCWTTILNGFRSYVAKTAKLEWVRIFEEKSSSIDYHLPIMKIERYKIGSRVRINSIIRRRFFSPSDT